MNEAPIPFLLLPFPRLRRQARVALALAPTLAVLLVRPILPAVLSQTPAAMHYPAVFLAAWIGGLWPGLLSTLVCSAYSLFVLRPQLVTTPTSDVPGLIRSFMFLSTAIFFTLLVSGLQRALIRAQGAIRLRNDFLSLASHELKTPLTSLTLQTQLRMRRLDTSLTAADFKKMVEFDLSQLTRLNRLIDNMLDISRIESGRSPFHPIPVDLCHLVREVTEHFGDGSLRLEICEALEVECDVLQMEQVVVNLLSNASKYGQGSPVTVSVSRVDPGFAVICVKDEGPGIAPEHQEKIFQKFERLAPASQISGLGLGLFICRELVGRHGGTIAVESALGKGAIFRVHLPLRPPA